MKQILLALWLISLICAYGWGHLYGQRSADRWWKEQPPFTGGTMYDCLAFSFDGVRQTIEPNYSEPKCWPPDRRPK
jgi:hypothetical protein